MDAKHALGEPRVLISRTALLHNARLVRRAVGDAVRICAIVKADAYGHGAARIADALCNLTSDPSNRPAVDALAVASLDEAAALPDVGETPILVLRPLENVFVGQQRARLEQAIRNRWTLTVCTATAADDINRIALSLERQALVQVMLDTGLCRSGVDCDQLDDLLHRIDSRPALRLVGLCTHFANADRVDDPFTHEQLARYRQATDPIATAMPGRFLRHVANSSALFTHPLCHLDMVRPGISLYGIDPLGRPHLDRPLRPVMRWVAPLIAVQSVKQGASVGYGQTWKTPSDTRIGLLPVGYADGYPRCFAGKAKVCINGKYVPLVGRVSMDMITIDLGDARAQIGDDVTLLDSDPLSPISVYALAAWAETIPYEILARIGPRITRVNAEPLDEESDPRSPGIGRISTTVWPIRRPMRSTDGN